MSALRAVKRFYGDKDKRGWDKGYFFIDLHGTVLKPNYTAGKIPKEFYPYAKETLQLLTKLNDIVLIMYTCSHQHEIEEYIKFFKSHNIEFKYINENPEILTDIDGYGCYDKKPYINVLLDDKAGFDCDKDWEKILFFMKNNGITT